MIVDLLEAPDELRHRDCDVFIAGAGPAGISLALELAGARPDWHIVLAEAGGLEPASPEEQDIYRLELGQKSYSVADICRRRLLGGTTVHWGGWSKPPDATDYEPNPRWESPAWPFGPAELENYLAAACRWCEIDDTEFEVDALGEEWRAHSLSLADDSKLAERLFRFSPPTRFGRRYHAALAAQENLSCLLHANLSDLVRRGDRLTQAHVGPLGKAPTQIRARYFVLAMGGIETTRFLLNLRGDRAADGEGVYSPHLGRHFADHFGINPGIVLAPADLRYSRFMDSSGPVMPVLTHARDQLRVAGQNNSCIYLWAQSSDGSLLGGYGGSPALGFRPGDYWHYHVKLIVEPQPNPASRVELVNERCALGLRRARLDWRIHDSDFASAYQLFYALGDELSRSGQGRLQLTQANTAALRAEVTGGCHHMGTVRMSTDSEEGVTDPDLRVFGSENLYVSSAAVIPRYGYSNPTLTVVALSVRLAHHLAGTRREFADDQPA